MSDPYRTPEPPEEYVEAKPETEKQKTRRLAEGGMKRGILIACMVAIAEGALMDVRARLAGAEWTAIGVQWAVGILLVSAVVYVIANGVRWVDA